MDWMSFLILENVGDIEVKEKKTDVPKVIPFRGVMSYSNKTVDTCFEG